MKNKILKAEDIKEYDIKVSTYVPIVLIKKRLK